MMMMVMMMAMMTMVGMMMRIDDDDDDDGDDDDDDYISLLGPNWLDHQEGPINISLTKFGRQDILVGPWWSTHVRDLF